MSKYIIIALSFFLEGALSNIFYSNTLFLNLFTILSLYIIYPFFKENKKNYYILATVLGFLYDITYMKAFGINLFLFPIFSILISMICDNFEESFFSNIVTCILIVTVYRFITYLIFIIFNYELFSFAKLLMSIYSSIILNIIYVVFFYFLLQKKKSKL